MTDSVNALAGLRLFVTGGTGFVGSAFVRHAVEAGGEVTVAARAESDAWRLAPVAGGFARWNGSLHDLRARAVTGTTDVVVHCAAAGVNQRDDNVHQLVETNISGTLAALEYAVRAGASRFVLVGTSGEYGPGALLTEDAALRPTSEYGATRAAATLLALAFGARRGIEVVVVRPFAVYGPYEAAYRLVPYAVTCGLRGEPLVISTGVQTRDYVYVSDVATGMARACREPAAAGGIFNLATGVETRVVDLVSRVALLTGKGSDVVVGGRPDIPGEMWRTSGSPERARATLGWSPAMTLEEGLAETIAWFRQTGMALAPYRLGAE